MKASEYLLKVFNTEGIKNIFMVPGGHVDPLMSALGKVPEIQGIVAAHEGGALFMADGYAKVSGKFGVALGIGGPGVTNMVTGIATAYVDKTPVFVVTGEAKTCLEGRGVFQDSTAAGIEDNSILQSITSKRLHISHLNLVKHHIDLLLRNMLGHATRGPVQLSFPSDLQIGEVNYTQQKLPDALYQPRFLDNDTSQKTWALLKGCSKVAILAGTGVLHANASRELVRFAEQYEIPVATTLTAKGVFPEDHRLSLGVLGWYGNRYAVETLLSKEIEILIVLGSRLHQPDTMAWTQDFLPAKALIINDINEASSHGGYPADLFVLGDAYEYLCYLNEANSTDKNILLNTISQRKNWLAKIKQADSNYYDPENLHSNVIPIHPARVTHELRQVMPRNTILFAGEGASSFIASHYWTCYGPQQYFTEVKYLSPMGWSIAAAIGGKLAKPDAPVVALIGDGSMLMHGMEIHTAARYNIPVIFVLFNNGAHGNPQLRGRKIGKFEEEFLSLPIHDWAKFAEALGVTGFTVTDPEQLKPVFTQALALKKPVLVDVRTGNYPTPTYAYDRYMS
jgi:acetolactate synthase I/II/III large subunit